MDITRGEKMKDEGKIGVIDWIPRCITLYSKRQLRYLKKYPSVSKRFPKEKYLLNRPGYQTFQISVHKSCGSMANERGQVDLF